MTDPATNPRRRRNAAARIPYAAHQVSEVDGRAVLEALTSGRLAQGPRVGELERVLAERVGVPHAVAVSSGTAALHVALAGLGIGPGDEVLVPTLTFVATANAVSMCGATPVLADVEPDTLTLSPDEVARRAGPRTRGAVAMHYGGHPADTDALREALGAGRFLLEDACHALGATRDGRPAGALGDAACFSFHPAKHITTGEGGAVTTASPELATAVGRLREHGIERDPERFTGLGLPPELGAEERGSWMYEMQALGANYRMPELSAALGRSQLRRLTPWLDRRRVVAETYQKALSDLEALELPTQRRGVRSAWHLYAVRLRGECLRRGRAEIFEALRGRGIGVQVHYIPVHLQPFYRRRLGGGFGDHPVAEREYLRLLTLPLHPSLTDAEIERVVDAVRGEIRRARR